MKIIALMALSLFIVNKAYSQNLVLDFSKKVKLSCPEASSNLSKKLLIKIIKSNGNLDCEDDQVKNRYFKKCNEGFSCKQSNSLYLEIKSVYSGNVIGGE